MAKEISSSNKTSSSLLNHQCIMMSNNDNNKESITLIWFDPNINTYENIEQTTKRLRDTVHYVKLYSELSSCVTYIQSIDKEKIFLIISSSGASVLLPQVVALPQVDSVFIFWMKKDKYERLTTTYPKIIGLFVELDSLCSFIREQANLVYKQLSVETFSFFDQNQQWNKDSSKQFAEFPWFQLFYNVIVHLPQNEQAKTQMIDMYHEYYRGNSKEQKVIDEFERDYRPEESIRWYLKQLFIYKLIDKAVRTKDIDQLYTLRFFISNLSESLAREHRKMLQSSEQTLIVYRGAILANEEFEKLKENEGKLIWTNGFLSASRCRAVALRFATKPTKRNGVVSVLFVIVCKIQELGENVAFADTAMFSDYPDEEEVLFDLSTAFQLHNIRQRGQIWLIEMSVSSDGRTITKDCIDLHERESKDTSAAIVFGRLLCNMGQYDKSLKYFKELLNNPSGEDLAWIEFNIGQVLRLKHEWVAARKSYDDAYNRMMNARPPRIKDSAHVFHNIGHILSDQKQYNDALELYQLALVRQEKFYCSGHVNITNILTDIGLTLRAQRKYDEALEFFRRALTTGEEFYLSGHADIARSLGAIALTLHDQGKADEALEFHQRALTMRQKFYPSSHADIATSLHNIGLVLYSQQKYDEALEFYRRALAIWEKLYPVGHVDIAASLHNMGIILSSQRKYNEALEFLRRALTIWQKFYPAGHVDVATNLHNIDSVFFNQRKYDEALEFYRQALAIRVKLYPADHVDTVTILWDMKRCVS